MKLSDVSKKTNTVLREKNGDYLKRFFNRYLVKDIRSVEIIFQHLVNWNLWK